MEIDTLENDANWRFILNFLPDDLNSSAKQFGAFLRRRAISSVEDLLRMILVYSATDFSLQSVCAWASALEIASMSKEAFFYRVRGAAGWLVHLLTYVLNRKSGCDEEVESGYELKIVDASCVTGPGAEGTEWRIHAKIRFDPISHRWRMDALHITDELVGENYGLHMIGEVEVVLGDGGYGAARSIFYAREFGGHVVVRITPYNIRVCNPSNQIIQIEEYEKLVPELGCYSMPVSIPVPPTKDGKCKKGWQLHEAIGWIPARLIGSRNDEGEVIWILTTLPESTIDDAAVMALYRIRWQVELLFKRLKSLLWLDNLPSPHKGPTAMSWIAGRLLVAALAEAMNDMANHSLPAEEPGVDQEVNPDIDSDTNPNVEQPSEWREFHLGLWALRMLVLGNLVNFFFSAQARKLTYSSRRKRRLQMYLPTILAHPPP